MVGAIPGILHREPLTALAGAGLAGAIGIAAGIGAGIAIGRSTDRSSDMSASSAGGAIGGAVGGAALALASRNFRPTALLAPIVGAGLGALAGLVGSVASDHALQSPFD